MRENREIPRLPVPLIGGGPPREGCGRTLPGMYEGGKSDRLVVPTKPPNKAIAAEVVEGRGPGEGNPGGTTRQGHRAGSGVSYVPDRVRRTGAGGEAALITSLLGPGRCDVGPEPGAQCGSSARWDLRGGPPARAVPTATTSADPPDQRCGDFRDRRQRTESGGADAGGSLWQPVERTPSSAHRSSGRTTAHQFVTFTGFTVLGHAGGMGVCDANRWASSVRERTPTLR